MPIRLSSLKFCQSSRLDLSRTFTFLKTQGDTVIRFMLLMIPKGYESADPGTMPDAKAVEAMMKYNELLQQAGVLITLEGLHPPSAGARVTFNGGNPNPRGFPKCERGPG